MHPFPFRKGTLAGVWVGYLMLVQNKAHDKYKNKKDQPNPGRKLEIHISPPFLISKK